ncbi:MAG: hypothetical protein RR313_08565 [Anaerovoracaceae bacterium]
MDKHGKLLKEIVDNKKVGRYPFFELDLREPLNQEYIMSRFGGKEQLEQRYPSLNSLLLDTLANPPEIQDEDPKGFCAMPSVIDVSYDEKKQTIYAIGDMTPKGVAERLYVSINIYEGDKQIAYASSFQDRSDYTLLRVDSKPRPRPDSNAIFRAYVETVWQPQGTNILRSMQAYADYEGSLDDLVEKIQITAPVHKVTPNEGPIIVSYSRDRPSMVDYYYAETRNKDNKEMVFFDVKGSLKFRINPKEGKPHQVEDVEHIGAILKCRSYGNILYYGEAKRYKDLELDEAKPSDVAVYSLKGKDKTEIGWELSTNWNNDIPESVIFGDRCHDFDFSFDYRCKADTRLHKVSITSIDISKQSEKSEEPEIPPHVEKISKIQLYWGCLGKNTLIRMLDGREQTISSITQGCCVRTPNDGLAIVRNVIVGMEQTIYVIRTMNNMEVRATIGHPFKGESDFMLVKELNSQSSLMTEEGMSLVRYCYPEEYNDRVYNLELEGANSFFANGIESGTFDIQRDTESRYSQQQTEVSPNPEIQAEIIKLREDFENGLI